MTGTDLAPLAVALTRLGGDDHPAGAVVGVAAAGETSVAAAGWALLPATGAQGVPMSVDTLVDVASVTKIATTLTVMRLVGAGRLDLDEPVAPLLEGFRHGPDAGARSGITTAHLLAHRAGLTAWWPLYCRTTDREAALDLAERLPLAGPPDVARRYSDLGMMIVGRIVERITGTTLPDAFAELVAAPLGLRRTGWGPVDADLAAAASDGDDVELRMIRTGEPYAVSSIAPVTPEAFRGWRSVPTPGVADDGNVAHALGGTSGHAGIFAPIDELLRIAASPLDDSFVTPDVRARFVRTAADAPSQALGFRVEELGPDRIPFLGHPGFTGTFVGTALDRPLAVAVAATRLHGVRGTPVPTDLIRDTALTGVSDPGTVPESARSRSREAPTA